MVTMALATVCLALLVEGTFLPFISHLAQVLLSVPAFSQSPVCTQAVNCCYLSVWRRLVFPSPPSSWSWPPFAHLHTAQPRASHAHPCPNNSENQKSGWNHS